MTNDAQGANRDDVERTRRALIDAALDAYEDAGLRGLCAEGRWEAAVDAMRTVDLSTPTAPRPVEDLVASLGGVVSAVGGATAAPPGGGSVAASAGALAAALTQMVAGLTAGRPRYANVAEEMQAAARRAAGLAAELVGLVRRDAVAFEAVSAAYRLPRGGDDRAASARAAAIEEAMVPATEAPFDIARTTAAVAELAATIAERGNTNAAADAVVAAVLAEAACRAAAMTVRVNAPALRDTGEAVRLRNEAIALADAATAAATRALAVVDRATSSGVA
jgi:formiminotetrahydrofolate cyclodeaminase